MKSTITDLALAAAEAIEVRVAAADQAARAKRHPRLLNYFAKLPRAPKKPRRSDKKNWLTKHRYSPFFVFPSFVSQGQINFDQRSGRRFTFADRLAIQIVYHKQRIDGR